MALHRYTEEGMQESILEFKKRIETEKDFCLELFRYVTVRLLAFKYAYYVHNKTLIDDCAYDYEEKDWYVMGIALNLIKEDETSPCVDFDYNHPLAKEGISLANRFLKIKA